MNYIQDWYNSMLPTGGACVHMIRYPTMRLYALRKPGMPNDLGCGFDVFGISFYEFLRVILHAKILKYSRFGLTL